MADQALIHASAIAIEDQAILFVGASGSGKSRLAFHMLARALANGLSAGLIGDDQVAIHSEAGHLVASPPPVIAGKLELRGSGIVTLPQAKPAPLAVAVKPVDLASAPRIPEENARFELLPGQFLPLVFIDRTSPDPLSDLTALFSLSGVRFPGKALRNHS